jgi:hypothetical protein
MAIGKTRERFPKATTFREGKSAPRRQHQKAGHDAVRDDRSGMLALRRRCWGGRGADNGRYGQAVSLKSKSMHHRLPLEQAHQGLHADIRDSESRKPLARSSLSKMASCAESRTGVPSCSPRPRRNCSRPTTTATTSSCASTLVRVHNTLCERRCRSTRALFDTQSSRWAPNSKKSRISQGRQHSGRRGKSREVVERAIMMSVQYPVYNITECV